MWTRVVVGIPLVALAFAPAVLAQEAPGTAPGPVAPVQPAVPPSTTATAEGTPPPVVALPAPSQPASAPPPPTGYSAAPQVSESWYGNPAREDVPRAEKHVKGARMHDGFYLRLSLGAGYLSTGVESETDLRIRGAAISTDLWIGGTPARGFVVGGGYVIDIASSPTVATPQGKFRADATLSSATIGPFVDWFFDDTQGLHAGLLGGFSRSRFAANDVNVEATATGVGGSLFAGYDGWVADQWAIGVLVRASGAAQSSSEGDVEESVYPGSVVVEVTALNH